MAEESKTARRSKVVIPVETEELTTEKAIRSIRADLNAGLAITNRFIVRLLNEYDRVLAENQKLKEPT